MLSLVVAAFVGYWFYYSANAKGLQPWKWAAIGFVLFAGVAFVTANVFFLMASPIRADDLAAVAMTAMLVSFGLAFLLSFLVYRQFLRKNSNENQSLT